MTCASHIEDHTENGIIHDGNIATNSKGSHDSSVYRMTLQRATRVYFWHSEAVLVTVFDSKITEYAGDADTNDGYIDLDKGHYSVVVMSVNETHVPYELSLSCECKFVVCFYRWWCNTVITFP